jgi:phenylalanyl-tRNA synthetase beta chain
LKFSYQWLRELVPGLATEPVELQRLITMKTAECEGIEAIGSDWIIEIDNKSLTHRPDLWGHYGMAREVAAIANRVLIDPVKLDLLPAGESSIDIAIDHYEYCPRYSALVFENVTVAPSPAWLEDRLAHLGLKPINNIVDITNYILAELPQPMHAFDAVKLAGKTIFVRKALSGEQLPALNGETYRLTEADLVIADSNGAIALAGVIGGAASAISESTTRVVLESANFQASSVRFTSTRHRLRTDASMRFEKALDPENTIRGLARAIELLREVCPAARLVGGLADKRAPLAETKPIVLPMTFVVRKLGNPVSQQEVTRILCALGFGVVESAPAVLTVTVPTWRATKDISLKDDLVEEIGRMVGYDAIAPAPPLVAAGVPPANPERHYFRQLRTQIAAQGFTEVHNYSFITESDIQRFHPGLSHIAVQNPIASELTHLRRSLLPGLFKNIAANVRYFPEFRLFEIGSEIHLESEVPHLAAVLYNARGNEQDFFEMKRVVECLFPEAFLSEAEARPYEHPVRTAQIHWGDRVIGRIFELHPFLLFAEGIEGRAMLFDVDLTLAQRTPAQRQPLRKYPTSGFDLSVLADLKKPVREIEVELRSLAGSDLAAIEFVRQYQGSPLPPDRKSVSYRLEVGALDHTMTTEEVTAIRNRIIQGMQARGFELRGVE